MARYAVNLSRVLLEIRGEETKHRRQRRRLIGCRQTLPPRQKIADIRLLRRLIKCVQRIADRLRLGRRVDLLCKCRSWGERDRARKDKTADPSSPRAITQSHAAFRFLMRSSTTVGSASVDVSPSAPTSFSAILRRMRRIILPARVFGRPGADWMTSGEAIGPSSLRTSSDGLSPAISVT